jgi:hypothetical protein
VSSGYVLFTPLFELATTYTLSHSDSYCCSQADGLSTSSRQTAQSTETLRGLSVQTTDVRVVRTAVRYVVSNRAHSLLLMGVLRRWVDGDGPYLYAFTTNRYDQR